MTKIKLGVTLYSYTAEYVSGKYTFEDCVRRCAELGVDGYEIVATQMIPSYPYVSDEFLGEVNRLKAKYGVRPISYGANTDRGMRFDRDLNDAELVASTIRDIKAAHKMGCPVIRAQYLLSPENLVKVAPYAEEYGIKIGIEIHNPETPSTPAMQAYLEAIEKSGSKYIGFVPDLGAFADKPNVESYQGALEKGANKELLDYAVSLRYDDVPMDEAQKLLEAKGADPLIMGSFFNMYGFLTFRKNPDFEGLKRIMPYVFHIHGKFHCMTEQGNELSIPYEKLLPILDEAGYDGYIVSEYEGHGTKPAAQAVAEHIAMERRILGI